MIDKHWRFEDPIKLFWQYSPLIYSFWWAGRPTTDTRRLRLLDVKMVEAKSRPKLQAALEVKSTSKSESKSKCGLGLGIGLWFNSSSKSTSASTSESKRELEECLRTHPHRHLNNFEDEKHQSQTHLKSTDTVTVQCLDGSDSSPLPAPRETLDHEESEEDKPSTFHGSVQASHPTAPSDTSPASESPRTASSDTDTGTPAPTLTSSTTPPRPSSPPPTPTSSTYLLIHLIDTETNEPMFLRIERTKVGSLRSFRGYNQRGVREILPQDMIFPSDGTINDSEWVSMSLDLRLDSDDGHITQNPASNSSSSAKPSPNSPPTSRHPKYHFEDLWVALLATHDSSYHFAMDMQSWWFCYISMIVFGMSVEREGEVREYGLDDGRGEVRVCGDWVKIKRRQREMKRESESDQSRSHSKEKMYIYKPVWRQVRIEKVVQPTLRLAMEDVRQERAFDKNWQHSWIWEGSRTLWSAGA